MNMKRTVPPGGKKVKKDSGFGIRDSAKTDPLNPESRILNPLLLRWYDKNRRILPWRVPGGGTPDPYRIWLSEVMLQQTTVGAVAPYFQKFVKLWPAIEDLAGSTLDDVLREWAGLGYYRRARSLHACARRIVADYGGVFPEDEKELLGLPGFGPYTAAAVRAIAFNQRANVVDGNVERVVARMAAIKTPLPKAKAKVRAAASALLPKSGPGARYGDYAQALMDLGATICTPQNPKCELCPWVRFCRAYAEGIVESLPHRTKPKPRRTRRAIAFILTNERGEILLRQRPKEGLLGGMMEVPSCLWRGAPEIIARHRPSCFYAFRT
jgi:A/G-specific adenine glycosylase